MTRFRLPTGWEAIGGCAVLLAVLAALLTSPVWITIFVLGTLTWGAVVISRRVRGWYDEAWFAGGFGNTDPGLARGDRLTAAANPLRLSKALPHVVADPRRPAYRVRPDGISPLFWDLGPRFEARSLEVLEVVPGWHAFGPRGLEVLALADEVQIVPLDAYRLFALEPPDPKAILDRLKSEPLYREAQRASAFAESIVSQGVAPKDPGSGQMDHGYPIWLVFHDGWQNATRAVQLAAIGVVLGQTTVDPTAGWERLRTVARV